MYGKLAGMTGTADTEAFEFQQIYSLETVRHPDAPADGPQGRATTWSSCTAQEKYDAIIDDIKDCHARGQPVLVGTTSIENSELISAILDKEKLPHQVLNAKQHEREAEIVAQAGRPKWSPSPPTWPAAAPTSCWAATLEPQIQVVKADEALPDEEKQRRIAELKAANGRSCTTRW